MKNSKKSIIPFILCILSCLLIQNDLIAQDKMVWKGGTPGQENNWFCAKNWIPQGLPNEFSDVIIPGVTTTSFSSPIINTGLVEVNTIHLISGGNLTIEENAQLLVYTDHVGLVNNAVQIKGSLIVSGDLSENKDISEIIKQ